LEEIELEFGISFTEKLSIKIFEASSNQSINVKLKLK